MSTAVSQKSVYKTLTFVVLSREGTGYLNLSFTGFFHGSGPGIQTFMYFYLLDEGKDKEIMTQRLLLTLWLSKLTLSLQKRNLTKTRKKS